MNNTMSNTQKNTKQNQKLTNKPTQDTFSPKSSVKFLRDKMREADFRLVDLAQFLDISRPTAYKFIELYETGQRDKIESKILRLFEFIDKQDNVSKIGIIKYISAMNLGKKENTTNQEVKLKKEELIASLLKKENKTKIDFIALISVNEIYDAILEYLLECAKIIAKSNPSKNDLVKLQPLKVFYTSLNIKLSTIKEL